jgi:hypothetical protein
VWCARTARHTISANSLCRTCVRSARQQPKRNKQERARDASEALIRASCLDARGVAGVHQARGGAAHQEAIHVRQRRQRLAVVHRHRA